eukprot:1682678-Prymnesium_polylepis.1
MAQRHEGARHQAAVRSLHYRQRTRLGPSGALPRDEGLIFLDIMHISVPCMFTGHRIVVSVTHAKSGKRKTVR